MSSERYRHMEMGLEKFQHMEMVGKVNYNISMEIDMCDPDVHLAQHFTTWQQWITE